MEFGWAGGRGERKGATSENKDNRLLGCAKKSIHDYVKISAGATSEVSITATGEDLLNGLINIYDENSQLVHQFHFENIQYLSEVINFLYDF